MTADAALGPAGAALWSELHTDGDTTEMTVLVLEACRMADRLEGLASAISDDGLAAIIERGDGTLEVRIDSALSEARQQTGALRLLLADIAQRRAAESPDDDEDGLDDL